ncbi:hypothetical protein [Azospirillum rugosum]|uniref:Uncharacterized protein n=1 Tax=Azospirillum rugosum TaxID=416170 RepID=A0ABS4SPM7_9PROT|nr:hypothetical protein [Azospirillum rugosum]MBP2294500.1 hypothetical protein [Azospirillum rugosum]MDQ0529005.1 hypothetical protein [Azospirillum rugosum]
MNHEPAFAPEISFAEVMLRKGAELLQEQMAPEQMVEGPEEAVNIMARRLAVAATVDAPLVVHAEGGERPELFAEAVRLTGVSAGERAAALAEARQAERAVVFEFDGTGPLTGNRVVAAVLRPEDRQDLLEAYVAIGRMRDGAAQMTVAPATLRFDAKALGQTLSLIGPAAQRSVNAANAAMAHAAGIAALPGHEVSGLPAALVALFWHAFLLSSARARLRPTGPNAPTLH